MAAQPGSTKIQELSILQDHVRGQRSLCEIKRKIWS